MEAWIWMLIGLIFGALLGGAAVWWMNGRGGDRKSVAALQQENARFKAEVTDHFVETARLINQMTDSYKAVFDHLSGGAQRLVDPKDLSERLAVEHREVRLHRIGASRSEPASATVTPADAARKPQTTAPKSKPESSPESSREPKVEPKSEPKSKPEPQPEPRAESNTESYSDPLKSKPARPSAPGP
ncbi:MAG: hypothetical protein CVV18_07980 [Gammaproteobacteria bacterium HGW-Gammaproteobacteria-8]|nr:MAG: hypothetical protein CVV18_07980 [Gammaproteobacteria bacterium HGW-Gammaproteobacteria-8]